MRGNNNNNTSLTQSYFNILIYVQMGIRTVVVAPLCNGLAPCRSEPNENNKYEYIIIMIIEKENGICVQKRMREC
jgi:hypothetical protein